MWKASRYSSSAVTLAILAASAALVTSNLYDELISPVVEPVVKLVFSIGTLLCTPVEEVVTSDTPPDLSQLSLQYRTENTTITLKLFTAAQKFPATFTQYGPDKKMIVIAHGFNQEPGKPVIVYLNSAVQSTGEFVVNLDASSVISPGPNYFGAANGVKYVALAFCQFFIDLHQLYGHDAEKFHCIGFSLGAHICGLAAQCYNNKTGGINFGRVTGLDPAGPCYMYLSKYWRLNQNDAQFVDVFHTNAGVYGIHLPCGDVDFWANDGSQQPGCGTQICNHNCSPVYYANSIPNRHLSLAVNCPSQEDFRKGNCSNEPKQMGYYCPNDTRGNYFAQTSGEQPYWLGVQGTHYDPSLD